MATFTKVNDFVEAVAEKKHNLGADTLTIALSNTAPGSESSDPTADGNGVLANVTEISYTNLSSRVITTTTSAQTGGTYKLVLADLVLTAGGGAVAEFRYIYIYNDTAANDELVGVYDFGSGLILADTETLTIDFDQSGGVLTIA